MFLKKMIYSLHRENVKEKEEKEETKETDKEIGDNTEMDFYS
jgi:hypothetical protein